ncbi:potassium transporter TrkA [bacterium endosymbiont of Escarpia laminata]|nr:MAG: potassium transporter TrkA [bacterium endosymbiont of Escarpia laminata]
MQNIIFLIFRRMRAPLLALILTYAIAVLGLVLIPGQDADGNPWRMDFFHAFYFVSFMASTIGFGEIPFEFTNAQRLWVTFSIFFTVVVWLYSIGTLLTLFQDPTFQRALTERRFTAQIRRIRDRFYLICGYGETGSALIRALTDRDQHAVAIDIRQDRVNLLKLENLRQYVPALCADVRMPIHLMEAGLKHSLCSGVVALTDSNDANLKVAITAKLLHPDITVICRADSHDIEANMASFGTDYIIDPFDTFAVHLATALQAPCLNLLQEWLTGREESELRDPIYPPSEGLWVICGYGRFGKAVYDQLRKEGLELVIVEAEPEKTGLPKEHCVTGRGTEAETLQRADIQRAVGLIAGTDHDANNLSIIMTARKLNPDLFVIMRQNRQDNDAIIEALHADMVMHSSAIVANRIRVLLGTPMLHEFLQLVLYQDDEWACELVSRILALVTSHAPDIWEVAFSEETSHAVCQSVLEGKAVRLRDVVTDPRNRSKLLQCIPLMMLRNNERVLLPEMDEMLHRNDRILFCGSHSAANRMEWTLQNEHALSYILTGEARPQGLLWRWLKRKEKA